jgi:hypothetical protein
VTGSELIAVLAACAAAGLLSRPAVLAVIVPRRWRAWWRHLHPGYRPHIRVRLRRAVEAADRYRCVSCREPFDLQLDHIRPWSSGGPTALWNLALLCGWCNRVKSNYWQYRSGFVSYRPYGTGDLALAAEILRAERRARANPFRWLRACLALWGIL